MRIIFDTYTILENTGPLFYSIRQGGWGESKEETGNSINEKNGASITLYKKQKEG
jgi:hypothetical protein